MNRSVFLRNWKRYLKAYDKRSYRLLKPVFVKWGKQIRFENMNSNNMDMIITLGITESDMKKAYVEIYKQVGLIHGKRIGKTLNQQIKEFVFDDFAAQYNQIVEAYVAKYGSDRVVSVTETYKDQIRKLLRDRITNGMTVEDAAKEVQKIVRSNRFYKWQAERIARTESSAAANYGASKSAESVPFQTDKVWISSNDTRTRRIPADQYDHAVMNGVRVRTNEMFNVQGNDLNHPGDLRGRAANVINCRCAVGYLPRRDSDGNLIFK